MYDILLRSLGFLCGGVFVLGFAVAGIFLLVKNFRERQKSDASQNWPTTQGQVIATKVVENTDTDSDGYTSVTYTPMVTYRYQVAGQEYTSGKVAFGFRKGYSSRAKARQALANYSGDAQVTVYYDPSDPVEAVLERKVGGSTLSLVLGIAFLLIGLCLGCPVLCSMLSGLFVIIERAY